MGALKCHIENLFEYITQTLYQHRLKSIICATLFFGFCIIQLPRVTIDTSAESLLKKTDAGRILYDDFLEQFGRSEIILIAIESDQIFDDAFLHRLKELHTDLKNEVPYTKRIFSLVNARKIWGDTEALHIEKLLANWPETPIDMPELKAYTLNNSFYKNNIISADGKVTAIVIEVDAFLVDARKTDDPLGFDHPDNDTASPSATTTPQEFTNKESEKMVTAVKNVIRRYQADDFKIALSGSPVIIHAFNQLTRTDMFRCGTIALIGIIFSLAVLFRRISGVLLPLIIITSAMISTIALMAMMHISIKMTTTVLPAFLLAVGVADSVHILAIFFRQFQRGHTKEESIIFAVRHSGLAVLMTSLTTAAGLFSFSFAELTAIAEMGLFAAAGVILALAYTIVLLPPLLAVLPISRNLDQGGRSMFMDRILIKIADIATGHPIKITIICAFIFIGSIAAMFRLKYSDYLIDYFPDNLPIKNDVTFVDTRMSGIVNLEVIIDTGRENGIYAPRLLNTIESMAAEVSNYHTPEIYVGNVTTLNGILKEIHQAVNDNDPAFYRIPESRDIIAQELFLFQAGDNGDLERIVDSQFSKTRITIKTPFVDSVVFNRFCTEMKVRFNEAFSGLADVSLTGMSEIFSRTIPATLRSMSESYIIAFFTISIMMIFMVGNIQMGLISMFPNMLPILLIMGIIAMLDIPLDMTSMMLGSIAIGLVVDDTVHFMYNFRKYFDQCGDAKQAVRETLTSTGRALFITSLTLCIGFFGCMFATLLQMKRFGCLIGITIILALLADFFLAPALMVLITRLEKRKIRRTVDVLSAQY